MAPNVCEEFSKATVIPSFHFCIKIEFYFNVSFGKKQGSARI